MTIHIYKTAELTDRISEGDLSNPDMDTFDGTAGETKDRQLYLANEQTTLFSDITSSATTITLATARFSNGATVIVDSEQMVVTAGGGTATLTVTRGANSSAATTHSAGARIYTARNYGNLIVQPVDGTLPDESTWCILSATQAGLSNGTPGAAVSLGPKICKDTLTFWRRITVPPGTPVQNKTDIKLHVTGTETSV